MEQDLDSVCLVGFQYDDSNNGVNALTLGAIALLKSQKRFDSPFVFHFGKSNVLSISTNLHQHDIPALNVRLRPSFQFFHTNAIWICFLALLWYLFNTVPFVKKLLRMQPYIRTLSETKLFVSVAGGDSFSDIYGFSRFVSVVLPQVVPLLLRKRLVLLPQTYGPFSNRLVRATASWVMNKSYLVFARDRRSCDIAKEMVENDTKVRMSYDMAFALLPEKPTAGIPREMLSIPDTSNVIGFNVSGLLYSGGYTGANMFGLKDPYPEIVERCIEKLLRHPENIVVLIPHVFGDQAVLENDAVACRNVLGILDGKYQDRLRVLAGEYNAPEVKHIIGKCNFFVGSRMHACIAAVSQCVPAAAIAYSDKFLGVMNSIQMDNLVLDARSLSAEEIARDCVNLYDHRDALRLELENRMPGICRSSKELPLESLEPESRVKHVSI